MAAYNAEMNKRLYEAAGALGETERQRERGAFFGSIEATLSHLLWADIIWMSRLAGWAAPAASFPGTSGMAADFESLATLRQDTDARLALWAAEITPRALEGDLTWTSASAGKAMTMPRAKVVTHMFNHQTHHRGQVHAMLTAAGARTGDTDLHILV
ncbi:DinB family protein [Acetobacteraceae bacterium H6797]|nr:DinB family protein [Acetobacteraceae bacterium H6797]